MKILFFGDIIGEPGRKAIAKIVPEWREKYEPDLVIANGENLAHGAGVTEKSLKEILDAGIDVVTSGNHIFNKKEALNLLDDKNVPLIRPANWPPIPYGKGYWIAEAGIWKVLVVSLNGRLFFRECLDCPFRKASEMLEQLDENFDAVVVDFHAEATSEKKAMGYHLDGKVAAVLGTHTHVQTADEKILPGGTAFISDVGMVGVADSVIGFEKNGSVEGWLTQVTTKWELAKDGPVEVCAVLVEVDNKTKLGKKIERLQKLVVID